MTGSIWILGSFFAAVVGLIMAAGYWLVLRPQGSPGGTAVVAADPAPASFADILHRLGEVIPSSAAATHHLRKPLMAAGYRHPSAVTIFWGIKCSAMLLFGLVFGALSIGATENGLNALIAVAAGIGCGHLLPDRILGAMGKARRWRLHQALPDALDLMVLCLEAGQSLDQAMVESGRELQRSYPDLSAELALVHLELRAGTSRAEALRKLADRNGEPELRKLANVLLQSDRFGTSMGPALRTHAKYLRIRRKQKAEEAARKISIKLIFPIFFLIFPCMLLATVGPAMLQLFTQVLPMMRGQ